MRKLFFLILPLLITSGMIAAQQEDAERKAKRFLELVVQKNYEEAAGMFNTVLSNQFPAERLATVWNSVQMQMGSFQKVLDLSAEETGGFLVIIQTCKFENTALDLRLVFDNQGLIGGIFFAPVKPAETYNPPEYNDPSQYREVKVEVVTDEFRLPAILTTPIGKGPFPGVVLVHGSGAHDMDASIGPNKVFADLAAGLSSNGIAVLRYDKRNFAYGTKAFEGLPVTIHTETAVDALSAVSLLMKRKEIDPAKVYILGHSLGAMAAPRIASRLPKLAGIIMMAGNARPLEDLILEQVSYLYGSNESSGTGETLKQIQMQVERVKKLQEYPDTPAMDLPLNVPASYWIDLSGNNQVDAARSLRCRILVLQGERDYQVTMEDFALWKEALSGKPNVTFTSYPNLNHLFHEGSGKSNPSEYEIFGNIPFYVIRDLVDWLK